MHCFIYNVITNYVKIKYNYELELNNNPEIKSLGLHGKKNISGVMHIYLLRHPVKVHL